MELLLDLALEAWWLGLELRYFLLLPPVGVDVEDAAVRLVSWLELWTQRCQEPAPLRRP